MKKIIMGFLSLASSMSFAGVTTTPTVQVTRVPFFYDDLDFQNMKLAIDRQLEKFAKRPTGSDIQLGNIIYPYKVFARSLKSFRSIVATYESCRTRSDRETCNRNLNNSIQSNFNVFSSVAAPNNEALFTGYHTPLVQASLTKSATFPVGLHTKPVSPEQQSFTRNQINFDSLLKGTPYEFMYMQDYFDQYLLHIQGGGKIVYQTQQGTTSKYLTYDASNGRPFRFISVYMRNKGYITDLSNESQRAYLNAHPEKWREIYDYSPSYVYFKVTDTPPNGNDAVSLTDNRSMATDSKLYSAKGLLSFVQTQRPTRQNGRDQWNDFSRFFIDHDTGGAIKGAARADLYFGEDDYAAYVANIMKANGNIYFLALKPNKL